MTLRLDWCSHEAAKYAVEHWHYSRRLSKSRNVYVGCWEDGQFIGAITFGRGSNNNIGSPLGLSQVEIAELTRVALTDHKTQVSRIVSIAIKMLRKQSPGLRALVSYADPAEGHHGGIYQAMGWLYIGTSTAQRELLVNGRFMHKRTASSRWGTASPERIRAMAGVRIEYGPIEWKHSYLYPLDDAMRQQIAPLAKPYPKRAASIAADAPGVQPGEGGSTPTAALQTSTD